MNPERRTFHAEIEDKQQGAVLPPHWPRVTVGQNLKFRGWWWKVAEIRPDGIVLKPRHSVRDAKRGEAGKRR